MIPDAEDKNIYECELCGFYGKKLSNWTTHISTRKHKNSMKFNENRCGKYFCKICNSYCETIFNLHMHNSSNEHRAKVNCENSEKNIFKCENCDKEYKSNNSLWYHKKRCSIKKTGSIDNSSTLIRNTFDTSQCESGIPSIILELIRDNQEFKSLLVEQMKENKEQQKENNELMNKMVEITQQQLVVPTNITNNMNNTTNNNQKFNLNFFLNETCKDAMNIQEFIENIKITFEDLIMICNNGFVNGVSDLFMKQLKDMDITKRPIHCTDSKRETIYLKANNEWNKGDKDNNKLKDVIEKVEKKNIISLHKWCTENPDSKINNTPNNLLRDKIFLQTLQGDDKTRDKIIKNISKEVTIGK